MNVRMNTVFRSIEMLGASSPSLCVTIFSLLSLLSFLYVRFDVNLRECRRFQTCSHVE